MEEKDADQRGSMLMVATDPQRTEELIQRAGADLVVCAENGVGVTVVGGRSSEVAAFEQSLRGAHDPIRCTRLPVSHAFHTPRMWRCVDPWRIAIEGVDFGAARPGLFSTVTGVEADRSVDWHEHLVRQVTERVHFRRAVESLRERCDAFLEVGPGGSIAALAQRQTGQPSISIDLSTSSLRPWLSALGAAFSWGALTRPEQLIADRFCREFDFDSPWNFIANPCGASESDGQRELPSSMTLTAVEPTATSLAATCESAVEEEGVATASRSPLQLITQLVAKRTELPEEAIEEHHHFLDDLHMNSIAVGSVVAEACARLGLSVPKAPNEFATATLAEAAAALSELEPAESTLESTHSAEIPRGVESWVRCFQVVERPLEACEPASSSEGIVAGTEGHSVRWRFFGDEALSPTLPEPKQYDSQGVVLCVQDTGARHHIAAALLASAAAERDCEHFVLLQRGEGAGLAPWVRTLKLERPSLSVSIVRGDVTTIDLEREALETAATAKGFREVLLRDGDRHEPQLQLAAVPRRTAAPSPRRWLVVGGGYGIAAECALAAAQHWKRTAPETEWVLVGRSDASDHPDIVSTLERFRSCGVDAHYYSADVTDAAVLSTTLEHIVSRHGEIDGVVYGAGFNEPTLISQLDQERIEKTLAPKVDGLQGVLRILGSTVTRLVTFGSIIGRSGLQGEADYALANAWLREATSEHQRKHPHCRALCLEWSVWSGVGMGNDSVVSTPWREMALTPSHRSKASMRS